jgi:hypothetical protein
MNRSIREQVLEESLKQTAEETTVSKDHFKSVAIQEVLQDGDQAKFSLRSVVSRSGYGFSTFYRFWKRFEDYLIDAYGLGVASYLKSERQLITDFQGDSPTAYFEMIAWHAIAGNNRLPRSLLRSVLIGHLKGRISALRRHIPKQTAQIAEGFELHFGDQWTVDRDKLAPVLDLHATYMLMRKVDDELTQDDQILVSLMVDSALSCLKPLQTLAFREINR